MKIEQNEKRKRKREKGEEEEIIIFVMASRRRATKELGRVTFSLTPRPVVAHLGSLRDLLGVSLREKQKII